MAFSTLVNCSLMLTRDKANDSKICILYLCVKFLCLKFGVIRWWCWSGIYHRSPLFCPKIGTVSKRWRLKCWSWFEGPIWSGSALFAQTYLSQYIEFYGVQQKKYCKYRSKEKKSRSDWFSIRSHGMLHIVMNLGPSNYLFKNLVFITLIPFEMFFMILNGFYSPIPKYLSL